MHVNIRSLYKKIDQLTYLYSNIDFLCCSETWLSDKYVNALVSLPGMYMYRNDRCNAAKEDIMQGLIPKRGGGVAIYVKDKWSTYTNIRNEYTKITKNFESICISVKKPNNRHMTVLCLYRPPKGNNGHLIDFLHEFVADPGVLRTEIWIMGDFNINFMIRNCPDLMKFNKFLRENNLKQLIRCPTRFLNKGGSCIDWVITSSPYVTDSGVLDDLLSDHFPVYANRKKDREVHPKVKKKVRVYKKFDPTIFENLLLNRIDWDDFFLCEDPDSLWDIIYECITGILEVMCPYKNIFIRKDRTPWFTNEIYECIKKRSRYIKLYRETKNQDIFMIAKYFRNRCNRLVREAKSAYIRNSLETNRSNPKKFWRTLNSILKSDTSESIDVQFYDKTVNAKVPIPETCNFLNNYFANIGNRKCFINDVYDEAKIDGEKCDFGMLDEPEVRRLISEMDTNKDSCIEGVSADVIKVAFTKIVRAICHMFSMSLTKGIFPRKWAMGFINILPKGGDKSDPSNWRPITQTCVPAKLLEKIVQKRLMSYLSINNVLSESQFGFRKGRSTQQAIFELNKDLNNILNKDEVAGVIFLDISKAFDSLDHILLLNKLREIGLAENSIKWFESYLNRRQVVRHNGATSDECIFKNGIPQGSCLGPTLFIFYINGLFEYLLNVKVLMFADDCVIYASGTDWLEVRARLQSALDVYIGWGMKYNLLLNASKSKAMLLCNSLERQHIGSPAPFNAGNRKIIFVHSYCYLGCVINDELNMESEFKAVYRKAERKVYMLGKLRYFVDKVTALLIYKQAVLPYFDYGGFLLASCNQGQRKDLQTLQNNALRICLRYRLADRISERTLHIEGKLQSLEQRRNIQLLKLMYQQSKNIYNIKVPVRPTRATEKIVFNIPTRCTTKYLSSCYYLGTQLWNKLTENTQRMANIKGFEKCIMPMYKVYQAPVI